jgi:tetratricopeptide (TPR) repeat protein
MMRLSYFIFAALLTVASGVSSVSSAAAASPQSAGAERFEVLSVKEVRPALVNTVAALKKGDVAEAKTAFDAYDSAWNGIEVYINTRDKTMYSDLEQNYQAQIAKGLNSPIPDTTALLAQAQAMLGKYDEAISLVENGAPLNPLYDDVARLRIVRANLREVTLALRAGDFAKARKSFAAFDDKWDSIEDIVKARSADSYADIEKGMIQIEQALMPAKPDVDQVTALVKGVMDKYNAVVADVTEDARGH